MAHGQPSGHTAGGTAAAGAAGVTEAAAAAAAEAATSAGHGQHFDHECRRIVCQSVSPLVSRYSTVNRVSWLGLWAGKSFRPTLVGICV